MTFVFEWKRVVHKGDMLRLQIGQLPERLVIVDADSMRLIRFNNIGGLNIDIFTSQEGESVCSVNEEHYIFSFSGGNNTSSDTTNVSEYNLWMGRVGQIFMFRFTESGEVKSIVIPAPEEPPGQPLKLIVYDISPSKKVVKTFKNPDGSNH